MIQEDRHTFNIWSPRPCADKKITLSKDIVIYGLPLINIAEKIVSEEEIQQLQKAQVVIFTSQYAIKYALHYVDADFFASRVVVSIGNKTTDTLKKHDINVDITTKPPHSSESLLNDKRFQDLSYQYVTIIGGVGGRDKISNELTKQEKNVSHFRCYQRDKILLSKQIMLEFNDKHKIGGIILSSAEIAETVARQLQHITELKQSLFSVPVFVFSERIGMRAKQLGFQTIIVSQAMYY